MQNTNIFNKITEEAILQTDNNLPNKFIPLVYKKEKPSLLQAIGKFLHFINPFKRKQRIVYESVASYNHTTFVAPVSSYTGSRNENYLLKLAQQEFNNMDITQTPKN